MTTPTIESEGVEDWPAPLPGLGRIWACTSQPGAPVEVVAVMLTGPEGTQQQGNATMYRPNEFRKLVARLQVLADELPDWGG